MFSRGQGTIEYLIILAIIIVIALIVVGLSGNFFGQATAVSEGASKSYWQTQNPFSITDYSQSSGTLSVVVKNQTADELDVYTIYIDSVACEQFPKFSIAAGDTNTLVISSTAGCADGGASSVTTCTTGSKFSYDIDFNYATDYIPGQRQNGQKDLVGTCA